jgi:dipeptidyl aminopeptidase/acylaminoacyl peptidase
MEERLLTVYFRKLLDALRIRNGPSAGPRNGPQSEYMRQPFSVLSDGLKIKGEVFFPSARPSRMYPCLIICHGIPGAASARPAGDPGYEALAQEFASLGMAAVVFNFRGCGNSGGDFDMMGWARDLEAVLDRILNTPHVDPTRVMILGFSGGGAAAIKVAAETNRIYALAIAGTPADFHIFDKAPDEIVMDFMERGIIRDPSFPADVERWIQGFVEIEPQRWARHFKGRYLLIVHGDQDELIPLEHARRIHAAAPAGSARLLVIEGGLHRLRLDRQCIDAVKGWVIETLGWRA